MRTFSPDHRFDAHQLSQTIYPLVVVLGPVPCVQFICESSVSIDSMEFSIDVTKFMEQFLVFALPDTLFAVQPFIIGRPVQVQHVANRCDGIAFLFMKLLYGQVKLLLAYAAQDRLLSISCSFFKTVFSISFRLFSTLSILFSARKRSTSLMASNGLRFPRLSTSPSTPCSSYLRTQL